MFDFSFSEFISEDLVRILYAISIVLAIVAAIAGVFAAFSNSVSAGIGALILGPVVLFVYILFIRVLMEFFIVFFRIADYLKQIAENTAKADITAKVDNTALQDGYQLYHHTFFFNRKGTWSVIQQGMNDNNHYARRYHWKSEAVDNFVCEPHQAICCDLKGKSLNMVASESEKARQISTILSKEKPDKIVSEIKKVEQLILPKRHDIKPLDLNAKRFEKIMIKTHECQPDNFEALLGIKGVGPKTIRALSLLSELVYGAKPSFLDPARFSFSHGGKDGHPYPVDKNAYDFSINFLKEIINKASVNQIEKRETFKRLSSF